jgi:1-acyl-sn-glycerol-3-phosphate acyltransferase
MSGFLTFLFMVYFFSTCAVCICVNAIICLLTCAFDPLRRAVHSFSCYWGYSYFQINPFWRLHYEGVENIKRDRHYVLIANHQSLADILVCYGLHRQYKWISKESIVKVPFIGWNMLLNQYIFLKRGDMKSIKEMMQDCKYWLNKGSSVMIFPEGTRSEDGKLQSFRDGAFRLSLDCNVELIPIVIDGTWDLLPKGGKALCFKKDVKIKVLPPISPADYKGASGKMRADVHKKMAETLAQMRGLPVEQVITAKSEKADKHDKIGKSDSPHAVSST